MWREIFQYGGNLAVLYMTKLQACAWKANTNWKHARYLNSLLREYSCTDQQRVLRILDTRTKSPMLSWPEHYHDDAMAILDDPLPVDTVSCIHCSMQSRRILTPLGRTALCERITIPYGCITFTITQVSSDEYNVRSTNDQTR